MTHITILGKSEATITMICDNLESLGLFPSIVVVNNLNLDSRVPFGNPKFNISESQEIDLNESQFVMGGYNPEIKRKIFETFGIATMSFLNIVNKSSQISSTTKIGTGVMINSFVAVAAHSKLGNFVTVNRNASIGHHSSIGDFVTINPGATICGNITIGDGTMIGAGAVVRDGVAIGRNCIIGAGSVVVKDVPDGVKGYGNPFKVC